MKRRILFVDDEPNVLAGLRNRLHRQQRRWDMTFVQSGAEALEQLRQCSYDVIVTDMRMPQMDGAALLARVQNEFPHVVRIVLSGHAEMETALRAVPVAHQFLSKPSEPGTIEEVVERACNLQLLIGDEVVQRAVGKIDKLPTLPKVYNELIRVLDAQDVTVDTVAKVLQQDMAMSAKILQMVNSAFFRLSRSIVKLDEAVAYLGFNTIKHVVLAVEVFQNCDNRATSPQSLELLQHHAFQVATLASTFFGDKRHKDDAFIAGLLHDIGKLVMITELPEHVERVFEESRETNCAHHVAEARLLGATHAEVGGYLLGLWGLPYPIVEAVANHHAPERVHSEEFGLLAATHIADALVNETQWLESGSHGENASARALLDTAFIERLGLTPKLEEWRRVAKKRSDLHGPVER